MIEEVIARQLQLPLRHVQGAVRLLREGATVPFISRYRKEATGSMDEVQVGAVKEALERLTALEARRATVLETIGGQGRLTDELRRRIEACWDPVELEDLYLPYRPKRRTRAAVARERGLEPLAELLDVERELARALLRCAPAHAVGEAADVRDLLRANPLALFGNGSGVVLGTFCDANHLFHFA